MTLQQLRYFIQVVASGSITSAANVLYMRQPSLSKAISDLEGELGVRLLNRSAHGVTLTDEGEAFLARAREVVTQADRLGEMYKDVSGPRSSLTISVPHDGAIVRAMLEAEPTARAERMEVRIREAATEQVIEDVRSQRSEVGVALRSGANRSEFNEAVQRAGLRFAPFTTVESRVLLRQGDALAGRDLLTADDLADRELVEYAPIGSSSHTLDRLLMPTPAANRHVCVNDWATAERFIRNIGGYAFCLPLTPASFDSDLFVTVPYAEPTRADAGILSRPGYPLSEAVHTFVSRLTDFSRLHGESNK